MFAFDKLYMFNQQNHRILENFNQNTVIRTHILSNILLAKNYISNFCTMHFYFTGMTKNVNRIRLFSQLKLYKICHIMSTTHGK